MMCDKQIFQAPANNYMNCLACGSTNLIEGKIIDEAGGTSFGVKPLEVSMWKAVFGIDVRDISAYACVHCGHLQMSVDFPKKIDNAI